MRREGSGTVLHNGCTLLFSGCEKGHKEVVGMLLSKTASKSLIEFNPISSTVIIARGHGQGHDITIVQSYASTSDNSDDEVDEFYATIQEALDKAEKRDIKMVMGDFNAKVSFQVL